MPEQVTIELWDLPSITTYQHVVDAYHWCVDRFGPPGDVWQYGRATPAFTGSLIISSPMEITHLTFSNAEDALQFKLTFS